MKITLVPKTVPGRWSVGLLGGLVLFFVLLQALAASGQRGGDTFFSNPALAVPALLAGLSGIAAFFTGVIGIVKSRERAVLVMLAVIIGLFVLVFCLGEITSPH